MHRNLFASEGEYWIDEEKNSSADSAPSFYHTIFGFVAFEDFSSVVEVVVRYDTSAQV